MSGFLKGGADVLRADMSGPGGALRVGYMPAEVAVVRTVEDKLREAVSVFDFMTEEEVADVRGRTFLLNVTPAIQRAIDYASSRVAKLVVPSGLYRLVPNTPVDDEDTSYATVAALLMKTYMYVAAESGAHFKIADGISTDAAPQSMAMFATTDVISNVSICGLIMDMNGNNNPISPLRPVTYRRYNQSQILVSGKPAGVAARIVNMTVEENKFINNPGVSCLCAAQSNQPGIMLGRNWKINHNEFLNNGYDSDDHSAVFAWVDDVQGFGNVFENDRKFHEVGKTGGNTCVEIHGSRQNWTGNLFKNYYRGIWVAPNLTAQYVDDNLISANIFETHFYGVDFFRTAAGQSKIRNTTISGNTFRFDSYTFAGSPQQKSCIQVASEYAASDVLVANNKAHSTDTVTGAAFMTISTQGVAGQEHDNIVCAGNTARGFVTGMNIRTSAASGMGCVSVVENTWFEPLTNATFSTPIGVFVDPVSPIRTMVVSGNKMVDERAVPPLQYGVYIQAGTITDLYFSNNFSKGSGGGADYYEAGAVDGKKHGTFENIGFMPTFQFGGVGCTVGDGSVAGAYNIRGDDVCMNVRLTIGSTTVVPAGTLEVVLPVVSGISGLNYLGSYRIFDSSANVFRTGAANIDGTANVMTFIIDSGLLVNTNTPITFAAGDQIAAQITYRRASS